MSYFVEDIPKFHLKIQLTCFYSTQHDATSLWVHTTHPQVPGLLQGLEHYGTSETFDGLVRPDQLATVDHGDDQRGRDTGW